MAPDLVAQALENVRQELVDLRVKVERLIADNETRDAVCRITHDGVNARLKRHSDAFSLVRDEQDSMQEEITGVHEAPPAHPHALVTVARWQAFGVIAAAAISGGALWAVAKFLVRAIAHEAGIGG